MTMEARTRIGILQAEWPVQSQTFNCVFMLAQAGYLVELFLYEVPVLYELDRLGSMPNVQVHTFSKSDKARGYARRTWKAIKDRAEAWPRFKAGLILLVSSLLHVCVGARELYAFVLGSDHGLLPEAILQKAHALMEGKGYRCLIGVEKKGLIWAGLMGERLGIPYMYYSLELYTRDHPAAMRSFHARRTKRAEEKYHRRSAGTIVQDPERAAILLADNRVNSCDPFYVPVSLLGEPCRARSAFLQERFQLSGDQTLVLQFGQICEDRLSIELARVAQGFPREWALVFHGWGPDSVIKRIREIDIHSRILLSLDLLPSEQIHQLVASAHVGLALYGDSSSNDRLTAFSSEKVALYLQCGLPVIAFDYPGYRRLIDRYRCGVVITTMGQIPGAIERIVSSYEEFRSRAYECFVDCYEFSKPFQKVVERLSAP